MRVVFQGRGEMSKTFVFDLFLVITQEPQDQWKFGLNMWIPRLILHKIGLF